MQTDAIIMFDLQIQGGQYCKRYIPSLSCDGIHRLQTVRFESIELSQQLEASRKEKEFNEENTTDDDLETPEAINHPGVNEHDSSRIRMPSGPYKVQMAFVFLTIVTTDDSQSNTKWRKVLIFAQYV